jgi:hypothetical protein
VVEYVAARFREYGLETEVVPYDVLLAAARRRARAAAAGPDAAGR